MKIALALLLFLFPFLLSAQQVIHLLPDSALPTLIVFRPAKEKSKGSAVIICPGGAYAYRSDRGEGVEPAERLNKAGITAFVLDYRLPRGNDTLPSSDAFLAIRYLRAHHRLFKINPARIGIMGFSAGGHLASTAGTHFRSAAERPDFLVLAYPVISMADSLTHLWTRSNLLGRDTTPEMIRRYSSEGRVTDSTPGTFITHAMDDPGVKVENSLYFEAALIQHQVQVQMFLYAHGGHAYGVDNRTAKVQWIDACIHWIKTDGWKR